jgi:tetratricopeptide (TPR) repeat protein
MSAGSNPSYLAAAQAHGAGRIVEAERAYEAALRADPGHGEALHGLGVLYLQTRRIDPAIACLSRAAAVLGTATVRNNLGVALCAAGRLDEAAAVYREILAGDPGSLIALVNLGKIAVMMGNPGEAAAMLARAVVLAPERAPLQVDLGEVLGALGRHDEALAAFEAALAANPDLAPAHHGRGMALAYLGRRQEALAAVAKAVALRPADPAYRRAMLGLETVTPENADLRVLEKLESARLDPAEQVAVPFALAKAYEDLGDYARAFAAMTRGNAVKRAAGRYRLADDLQRMAAIAATFTGEFLAAHAGQGFSSETPVFIVGMPRSGTTLVEQILASHPAVFGGGEQAILPDLINQGRAGRDFPAGIVALAGDAFQGLGAAYAGKLTALCPSALRITDKLPLNFQLIGLIRLMLPQARIVHVRRDPLDTCFSCYSVLFGDDLDFSCDLADLGRYYRGYESLMEHWRAVLPEGAMLELAYEDLVGDLEAGARRLVAYCGLDWDARCLAFHETARSVVTASTLQVRRPLYDTSVGRAARFAPWLEPLQRSLAEAAPF